MPDQDIQFPINHALLEEAGKIKQERKLYRDRLQVIEAKKSEVSPAVYKKVKDDYIAKLNEITNSLLEKKTDIDRELASLYEARTKVGENLNQHKEVLEEIKFRHQIGEFDNAKYKENAASEESKISKFEKILAAVNSNIERYETIFSEEEDMAELLSEKSGKREVPISAVIEGSDYNITPEQGDYFAPEGDIHETPTSKSITAKNTETTGKIEARIIIIEGADTGREYQLKKENTIGRANTNMIPLKDNKVSRQHAVVQQTGSEFMIMDLNSSNGIFVNHERVKEHVLGDGDQIQIGDSILQFKVS